MGGLWEFRWPELGVLFPHILVKPEIASVQILAKITSQIKKYPSNKIMADPKI